MPLRSVKCMHSEVEKDLTLQVFKHPQYANPMQIDGFTVSCGCCVGTHGTHLQRTFAKWLKVSSWVQSTVPSLLTASKVKPRHQIGGLPTAYDCLMLLCMTLQMTDKFIEIHRNTTVILYQILPSCPSWEPSATHGHSVPLEISTFRRRSARKRFPFDPASCSSATSSTKSSKLSMSTWNHGAPAWHGNIARHECLMNTKYHKVTGPWWKMVLAFNIK